MNNFDSNKLSFKSQQDKKIWISTTAYRILYLLQAMLKENRSKKELVKLVSENNLINKADSEDTVNSTIKTLRKAGCKINRPLKKNNYKYQLVSTPFNLNLSEYETKILLELRNKLYSELDWKEVFIINDLYEKIFALTKNDIYIEEEKNTRLLVNINRDLVKELTNPKITGKKIRIKYISPAYGEEEIDIIPKKINFENGKLYIRCFNFKYNVNSIFLVERIISIVSVNLDKQFDTDNQYEVLYDVTGASVLNFETADYETILEQSEDYIKIKAVVDNEFWFIQRLLQFGSDFEIKSPDFLKEKLLNKVLQIRKRYEDDLK